MTTESLICDRCGTLGPERVTKKGFELISWMLFWGGCVSVYVAFIWPAGLRDRAGIENQNTLICGFAAAWLIHVMFRLVTRRRGCPGCGLPKTMIPLDSPVGSKLQRSFESNSDSLPKKVSQPTGRRWLRVAGLGVPALLFVPVFWWANNHPSPRQTCARFARNVADEVGGVEAKIFSPKTYDASVDKMENACIDGALAVKETRGHDAYMTFLNCIKEAISQTGLEACIAEQAPNGEPAVQQPDQRRQ